MKGSTGRLLDIMSGKNRLFVIPVYQRNYDWGVKQCEQLFDDLLNVISNNMNKHFFGSIVYKPETSSELSVIDGQQRITTVSILLTAMYKMLKEGRLQGKDSLQDEIYESYLINKWQEEGKKLKLKPAQRNQDAYEKLYEDSKYHIHGTNVTENYQYFISRLESMSCDANEFFDALEKLEVMDISLDAPDDDPQLIFESLNSTGLDLSEADKVRNYVLMGLPLNLQERFFNSYWKPIEEQTREEGNYSSAGCSNFIRHFLTLKMNKVPNKDNVYLVFKSFANSRDEEDIEIILQEMKKFAYYYNNLRSANTQIMRVDKLLKRFNLLERDVTMPFFMAIYNDYMAGIITEDEFLEMIKATDVYIFRRFVCGLPTNSLNKTFAQAHRDIVRLKKETDQVVDVYLYVLKNKGGSAKFPDDQEFIEMMRLKDFYHINPSNRIYLFECLENQNSKDHISIAEDMLAGDLTIEHIMPQTLSKAWKDELGDNWEQIHETYLHRIGNLTISGYNTEYRNSTFMTKKTCDNGFDISPYRINRILKFKETWGQDEIEHRGKELIKDALQYWSVRESNYIPRHMDMDVVPMGDFDDFTGRSIKSYEFMDSKIPVNTWREMYEGILRVLVELDSSVLYQLASSDSIIMGGDRKNPQWENEYIKIADDLYFNKRTSTTTKIASLRRVFEAYELETDELVFELKPE